MGLGILLRDTKVFRCHDNIADAVYHAELGSSAAILDAGYTIDSLMLRYRGVDWSDNRNWGCNAMCAHRPLPPRWRHCCGLSVNLAARQPC